MYLASFCLVEGSFAVGVPQVDISFILIDKVLRHVVVSFVAGDHQGRPSRLILNVGVRSNNVQKFDTVEESNVSCAENHCLTNLHAKVVENERNLRIKNNCQLTTLVDSGSSLRSRSRYVAIKMSLFRIAIASALNPDSFLISKSIGFLEV